MDFFRRLRGRRGDLDVFPIHFSDAQTAWAVRAPHAADAQAIVEALDLPQPAPTIFLSGGAGLMEPDTANAIRTSIEDGLVRFLGDHRIALIDGGTASGVMQLIGVARQRRGYTFPLIGVAPEKRVDYPGITQPEARIGLEAHHSHFVLTGGDQFGTESEHILSLAYALSGRGEAKRLVVVIDGGEIVRRETHRASLREPRFPLLVLEGSGRFADELAASARTGAGDPLIRAILERGTVHFIAAKSGADALYRWLENFFGY